jgi:Rps23 Pro-64 3,4-dihydroxylase Tpa1-like proline 4-hydroxylase
VGATFFFDPPEMELWALKYASEFSRAKPFRHVVIDGLFPDYVLDEVLSELPRPEDWTNHSDWRSANRSDSIKLSVCQDWDLGTRVRHLLNQFNSASFINFLENMTAIEGLIPDPHYFGAGFHQIERDGFVKIHADFNVHKRLKLDRRLNAILYLNKDWQDDWGGQLELWDSKMTKAVETVSPKFNRLVIFETLDDGFHGHPDPLTCPEGVSRKSLAFYYYTNGRPAHERSQDHGSLLRSRPGENFVPNQRASRRPVHSNPNALTLRDFVPPAASKLKAYVVSKRSSSVSTRNS